MKTNCFLNQKEIMEEWHCFAFQQISLIEDSKIFHLLCLRSTAVSRPEVPEENPASHRELEKYFNSLMDKFGKSLILHQNSLSNSFLKVSCNVKSEIL